MGYTILSSEPPVFDNVGYCERTKMTDHSILRKWVDDLSIDSLDYVRKDCLEAIAWYSENKKNSHYADTALYIGMRLNKLGVPQ